jgi:DNA-binding IclR family transcriptional regulator
MTDQQSGSRPRVQPKPGVPVVRALDRGMALLRAFTAFKPRQTLTQLAATAELDKGTARRLLHTLTLGGFVAHDAHSGLYSLTIGILELASAVETGRDIHEIAAPYLGEIAEKTGATTFLWVHHEGMALCVGRVRAPDPEVEATWFPVGARTPLNCGAGPRTLLGFISPEERELALRQPLSHRTPLSQTDLDSLRAAAHGIHARGWEFAVDDFVIGLAALGVPIFDGRGKMAGALSMTTLTSRLAPGPKPEHLDPLRRAAAEIGAKLM